MNIHRPDNQIKASFLLSSSLFGYGEYLFRTRNLPGKTGLDLPKNPNNKTFFIKNQNINMISIHCIT